MAPKKKGKVDAAAAAPSALPAEWQWCDGDPAKGGKWRTFFAVDSKILEDNYAAGTHVFTTEKLSFAIGVKMAYDYTAKPHPTQTNVDSGTVRPLRRLSMGAWEYCDDMGMWVAFYDEDNLLVERAWRDASRTVAGAVGATFATTALSWNKGYDSKYTFTFGLSDAGAAVGTQKNEESGKVRQLRRQAPEVALAVWDTKGYGIAALAPPTAASAAAAVAAAAAGSEESGAPAGWAVGVDVFAPPPTWQPQTKPLEYFTVAPGTAEYDAAIKPFLKTLGQDATILKLERIQNEVLWKFYALRRFMVAARNKGNANERMLFHGARVKQNMDSIEQFGFDLRVANSGSAGFGVYFAMNASYSNGGYVLQHPDKSKEMYICAVTLGSWTQGKPGLKRPPARSKDPEDLYDSVHNGVNVMAIVFQNDQAYPAYKLHYKPAKW